jgi:hypothetical protein
MSDKDWSIKLVRRRPYFLVGAILILHKQVSFLVCLGQVESENIEMNLIL